MRRQGRSREDLNSCAVSQMEKCPPEMADVVLAVWLVLRRGNTLCRNKLICWFNKETMWCFGTVRSAAGTWAFNACKTINLVRRRTWTNGSIPIQFYRIDNKTRQQLSSALVIILEKWVTNRNTNQTNTPKWFSPCRMAVKNQSCTAKGRLSPYCSACIFSNSQTRTIDPSRRTSTKITHQPPPLQWGSWSNLVLYSQGK